MLSDLAGDVIARKGYTRLDEVLDTVAKVIAPDQKLCLDIKDYGFEQDHVELGGALWPCCKHRVS